LLLPVLMTLLLRPLLAGENKFYAGMNSGMGGVSFSPEVPSPGANPRFALGWKAGVIAFPWLRVGAALGGWLFEPYGNFSKDPSKGVSISNAYLEAMVFPLRQKHFFLALSCGSSVYVNHHPDGINAHGMGMLGGAGYERQVWKSLHAFIQASAGYGHLNFPPFTERPSSYSRYKAAEVTLGINFLIPKKRESRPKSPATYLYSLH
jgi:hypothetical protein